MTTRLIDMGARSREYIRTKISGAHRRPARVAVVDLEADRARGRFKVWCGSQNLSKAETRDRVRTANALNSTIKFLARSLPAIRKREMLREQVLAVLADYRTPRKLTTGQLRSITTKQSACAILTDIGVKVDVISAALGMSISQVRTYACKNRKITPSERLALRLDNTPDAPDDNLGRAWFCSELLGIVRTARDIGALHVSNDALDLLGVALGIMDEQRAQNWDLCLDRGEVDDIGDNE